MSDKMHVIPCGVALIRKGREFLIAQRRKEDTFGSLWEFPGGKKHIEESFEACVAREVMEEIGIEVSVHEKFMQIRRPYHERIIWLNFFMCTHISGEPQAIECEKFAWVDVEKLSSYPFPPANEKVIRRLVQKVNDPSLHR